MGVATDKQIGYLSYLIKYNSEWRNMLPQRKEPKVDWTIYDFEQKIKVLDQVEIGDMIGQILDEAIPDHKKNELIKTFIKNAYGQ